MSHAKSKVAASKAPSQKPSVFSKQAFMQKKQQMADIENDYVPVPEAELREIEEAFYDENADQVAALPLDSAS